MSNFAQTWTNLHGTIHFKLMYKSWLLSDLLVITYYHYQGLFINHCNIGNNWMMQYLCSDWWALSGIRDRKSILVYVFTSLVKEWSILIRGYMRIITFHELNVTPIDIQRWNDVTIYKLSIHPSIIVFRINKTVWNLINYYLTNQKWKGIHINTRDDFV